MAARWNEGGGSRRQAMQVGHASAVSHPMQQEKGRRRATGWDADGGADKLLGDVVLTGKRPESCRPVWLKLLPRGRAGRVAVRAIFSAAIRQVSDGAAGAGARQLGSANPANGVAGSGRLDVTGRLAGIAVKKTI